MFSYSNLLKPVESMSYEETLKVLSAYRVAVLDEDTQATMDYHSSAARIFRLRLPVVTIQHFLILEELIPQADCDAWDTDVLARTLLPVKEALEHPGCPPFLLTRACRGKYGYYGHLAVQHLNCPEEDAVYWVLRNRR